MNKNSPYALLYHFDDIEIAPRILTTSIDFYDNSASLETAMRVVKDFRLKKRSAVYYRRSCFGCKTVAIRCI